MIRRDVRVTSVDVLDGWRALRGHFGTWRTWHGWHGWQVIRWQTTFWQSRQLAERVGKVEGGGNHIKQNKLCVIIKLTDGARRQSSLLKLGALLRRHIGRLVTGTTPTHRTTKKNRNSILD